MGYMDKKAPGRGKTTVTTEDLKPSGGTASNQQKNTSVPKRTVSPSGKYNVGGQVRVGANTKGTAVVKDPLNSYTKKVLPATSNPDGKVHRP